MQGCRAHWCERRLSCHRYLAFDTTDNYEIGDNLKGALQGTDCNKFVVFDPDIPYDFNRP